MQLHPKGILETSPDRLSTLEDAARRHPNSVFRERRGHGIDIATVVRLCELLLHLSKPIIVSLGLLSDGRI